jgi:hypothetical protein
MKYRQKPRVPMQVEAIQWTGQNIEAIFTLTGRIKQDLVAGQIGIYSPTETRGGYRVAFMDDWVVKFADGDVRPISRINFEEEYEPIS